MLTIEERFRSADGTDGMASMAAVADHRRDPAARWRGGRLAVSAAVVAMAIAMLASAGILVLGYA